MAMERSCMLNGCQARTAGGQLAAAQKILEDAQYLYEQAKQERVAAMAGALWCDLGEHAFGPRDRKRKTYKIESVDEETGEPAEETLTGCGPCAAKRAAMFQAQPKQVAAPPAPVPDNNDRELYTEYLEWKNGLRDDPPAVEEP